jgi:hypothetical protein
MCLELEAQLHGLISRAAVFLFLLELQRLHMQRRKRLQHRGLRQHRLGGSVRERRVWRRSSSDVDTARGAQWSSCGGGGGGCGCSRH